MPGTSGSGRRGLGACIHAENLYGHLRRGADLLRSLSPCGLPPEAEAWVEQSHAIVMEEEVQAARVSLASKLLEGDDVTDACLRLADQHVERYGPILRLLGAA